MNYSEEEKEAINNLNFIVVTDIYDNEVNIDKTKIINEYNQSVGIVLNLIQKQEKEIHKFKIIIENMAEDLVQGCNYEEFEYQKQKIIESFKKEVEKE